MKFVIRPSVYIAEVSGEFAQVDGSQGAWKSLCWWFLCDKLMLC